MKSLTEEEKDRIKAELDMWMEMAKARGLTPMFTHYRKDNPDDFLLMIEDDMDDLEGLLCGAVPMTGKRYVATTCVLLDENLRVMSRGACVVSEKDMPYKVDGRRRSLREAMIAFKTGFDDMHRLNRNGAQNMDAPIYRSELFPKLTTVERMRLSGRKVRRYLHDHRDEMELIG